MKLFVEALILVIIIIAIALIYYGYRFVRERTARWHVEKWTLGQDVAVVVVKEGHKPIEIGRVSVFDADFAGKIYELEARAHAEHEIVMNSR